MLKIKKEYIAVFNLSSTERSILCNCIERNTVIKVPTTLDELKEAAKTIYEKSNKLLKIAIDSLNNYYAIGMKNKGIDFTKELDFTSDTKEVVNTMRNRSVMDTSVLLVQINIFPFQNKK